MSHSISTHRPAKTNIYAPRRNSPRMSEQNDESDNSDDWDDSLLVKAFEKGMQRVKEYNESSSTSLPTAQDSSCKRKSINRSRSQSIKTKTKPCSNEVDKHSYEKQKSTFSDDIGKKSEWKVGQHCYCQYSEDQLFYEAVIRHIDLHQGTCLVEYCAPWGGEEEQKLSDLQIVPAADFRNLRDSMQEPIMNDARKHCFHKKLPPLDPDMPVPPPLPDLSRLSLGAASRDAGLDHMLMSYYMAGYHAGYFVGFLEGKTGEKSDS